MLRATASSGWRNPLGHAAETSCRNTGFPLAQTFPPSTASKRALRQSSRNVHTTIRGRVSEAHQASSQALVKPRQGLARCFTSSTQTLDQTSTAQSPGPSIHAYNTSSTTTTTTTSSVSPNEVAHFSRLAASWWDPHGPSRLLHLMNPLRFDFLNTLLPPPSPTSQPTSDKKYTYLDIGCGGGIFASACARHPQTASVTAIDPTPACIAVAQSQQRTDPSIQPPKLTYLNTSLEDLPDTNQYDIITLFEVLEHITSPSTFLSLASHRLKPGGWLVGSTIARHPISYITTKLIAEAPLIGVVPPGTHDWDKYINPGEMRGWFESPWHSTTTNTAAEAPGATAAEEAEKQCEWRNFTTQGVVYVPAVGWRVVGGSEEWGNYFFAVQKMPEADCNNSPVYQ